MEMQAKICCFVVVMLGISCAYGAEYNATSLEKAVIDLKPKDCLGNPLSPPSSVQLSDFVATATDLETKKVTSIPIRITRYDPVDGLAEIMFPFRKGMVYEVDLAPAIKKNHPVCTGKPVATE
ncbi:MAG: hypothetical protein HQL55_00835 [Magnetococcales bacterium]|nr:hypothetical protein [Magnetococcales bacterium]